MANKLSNEILSVNLYPTPINDVFSLLDSKLQKVNCIRLYIYTDFSNEIDANNIPGQEYPNCVETLICFLATLTLKEIKEIFYYTKKYQN